MQPSFPRLVLVRAAAVALVLLASGLALDAPEVGAASIEVEVGGGLRTLAPGTTLGGLLRAMDLRPKPGRLLAVDGAVVEPRAEPGAVYLNGLLEPRTTVLRDGDRILLVDGEDRTEGTKRIVTPVKGRRPGEPQFSLTTWPMQEVRVEGRISGEVVSLTYRPIGRPRRPREVALTFDDGPWPRSTRRILGILRRKNVHATFFVVGSLVERYPGIVRDLARAGMVIGDHSWNHPNHPPFEELSDHRIRTEIETTAEQLADVGVHANLFRPPGGSYDSEVLETARELGMRVVLWDVDSGDWHARATRTDIARAVLRQVHPGSIVLLHDGGGNQSATAAALPAIIKAIRRRGLRLVALR